MNKVIKIKNLRHHILMEIYDFCDDNYKSSGKSFRVHPKDLNLETIEVLEEIRIIG